MRQIAILVAVLILALVFNSILPKSPTSNLDKATIERVIIEDAKLTYGESATYNVASEENTGDKWSINLDITVKATNQMGIVCDQVFRRYYSAFPIVFREELYRNDCSLT